MTYLSSNQLKQYEDQGYISPIEVLSSSEALEARKEIELIEKKMPNEIDNAGRYNVHLISPKLDSIVHNSKILDAVESIIGKFKNFRCSRKYYWKKYLSLQHYFIY